jgi:replicative DNA helicase Mcm
MEIKNITEYITKGLFISEEIKLALLLQIISKEPINILLLGDNGTGKTRLMRSVEGILPNTTYITGNTTSRCSNIRDVVVNHAVTKSLVLFDNIDVLNEKDVPILYHLIDSNIPLLAAANPKFGRFDPYELIVYQIKLTAPLINRFDLIFILKDNCSKEKDSKLVKAYFNNQEFKPQIGFDDFTEFINECKKFDPKFDDGNKKLIEDYFVKMRSIKEGPCPISIKQIDSIAKLSKANAMLRHSDEVSKKDVLDAMKLLEYCLTNVGLEEDSPSVDIDRIVSKYSKKRRDLILQVISIIDEAEDRVGKTIPIDDLVEDAKLEKIDECDLDEAIEDLKKEGFLFEPREGFLSKI